MGSVQEVVPMELIVSEEIDSEFLEIVKPILRNKEFLKLGNYMPYRNYFRELRLKTMEKATML